MEPPEALPSNSISCACLLGARGVEVAVDLVLARARPEFASTICSESETSAVRAALLPRPPPPLLTFARARSGESVVLRAVGVFFDVARTFEEAPVASKVRVFGALGIGFGLRVGLAFAEVFGLSMFDELRDIERLQCQRGTAGSYALLSPLLKYHDQ